MLQYVSAATQHIPTLISEAVAVTLLIALCFVRGTQEIEYTLIGRSTRILRH